MTSTAVLSPVRLLAPILVALIVSASFPAAAGADDSERRRRDHDSALQALTRGEIAPLEVVLAAVKREIPGEVVGVELERRQAEWIYMFKIISPDGRILRVVADARTGKVLAARPKDR